MATIASEEEFSFLRYSPVSLSDFKSIITVKQNASWSYCGPVSTPGHLSSLPASFYEFDSATFTSSIASILLPLLRFVSELIITGDLNHVFFTVRATTPTHEFDKPRWHTDELFFSDTAKKPVPRERLSLSLLCNRNRSSQNTNLGTDWKICATLLGPPTLFIPLQHQALARDRQRRARKDNTIDHVCSSIRCVGCASAADAVRAQLTTDLKSFSCEVPLPGECAVFRLGRETGAVHSEPCMSESREGRVFVNIVPGTEEELGRLMAKWGMEYPRHWWMKTQTSLVNSS